MKVSFLLVFLFTLVSCQTTKDSLTVDIVEVDDINNLSINLDEHLDKDVDVFRNIIIVPEEVLPNLDLESQEKVTEELKNITRKENHIVYNLIIYRKNQGKIRDYRAMIISTFTYDKATYEWVNDSTVTFNLKNKFHSHEAYSVMGYGNTTTLITD